MIKKFLKQIAEVNLNQQPNSFSYERWSKGLSGEKILRHFKKFDGKRINRKNVIEQFKDYYLNPESFGVMRPFLFCMIWGYEGSGYGTARTLKYFEDRDLEDKLKVTFDEIAKTNVEKAFHSLIEIKYLSTSFASKVLYFAAKAKGIKNYPLIFDMRAATGLVMLTSPNKITDIVTISPRKGWKPYNEYCKQIHKWASDYNVEADKIETFLFNFLKPK